MPIIVDGNAANINDTVVNEKESRRRLLRDARMIGCEKEMLLLFAKYDKLLKNCTNEKERKDIGKIGVYEAFLLLGGGTELVVDGQVVYKEPIR